MTDTKKQFSENTKQFSLIENIPWSIVTNAFC